MHTTGEGEGDENDIRKKRRRTSTIVAFLSAAAIFVGGVLSIRSGPVQPQMKTSDESIARMAIAADEASIVRMAADEYSADPRYKSEQPFWDVYRGDNNTWYKEFRMKKETFNRIVRNSMAWCNQ